MRKAELRKVIYRECMEEKGFADLIRLNVVDEKKFKYLLKAVHDLTTSIEREELIDRKTIGCLFELPWEIENTVEHYAKQDKNLGQKVSRMADELRDAINDLLWAGII